MLGLSALVQAFPYEVPAWMPEVLVLLSGCVGDPAPVGVSMGYRSYVASWCFLLIWGFCFE